MADGTAPRIRCRQGARPGAPGVLAQRLRRRVDGGPHGNHGDHQAKPLFRRSATRKNCFARRWIVMSTAPAVTVQVALAKPTARAVVEHLLYESADAVTDPNHPPGCLAVQGALSCGDAAESIEQELMSRRAKGEQDLRQRFEQAIAEGDLPLRIDAADLAAYLSAILQGMSGAERAGGTTREQLRKIAEIALRALAAAESGVGPDVHDLALLRQSQRPQRERIRRSPPSSSRSNRPDAPPWPAPMLVRSSTGPPPDMVARSQSIHLRRLPISRRADRSARPSPGSPGYSPCRRGCRRANRTGWCENRFSLFDPVAPFRPFRRRQRQRVVEHRVQHVGERQLGDDAGEQFA